MQHTAPAAPAVIVIGSVLAHMPEAVSVLVGLAALWYYYLVITKLLQERKDARNKTPVEAD